MASTIQSQTIGSADLCIALAASQFGRPHGYGDNWNTLRIAINYNVEDTGANITGSLFRFGLCNGTTNMPGDATTNNSYGVKFHPTWSRAAGPPIAYNYATTESPRAFSRVGAVETTSLTNLSSNYRLGTVGNQRGCLFVDIIKGASYTFKYFGVNAAPVDATPADFLAQVGSLAPALTAHAYASPTGTGIAIDTGANGILDTVYVGWNLLTPRIFIGNLAVVRLA